ncbi:hypothetical protein BCV70DRAFT_32030 [Testicularia cyperi]|uniref:Uncharacterized protein n=1 Tax=Testicularia cyperi TaxID=1882483 RepID=A0A317XKV1_9BASI|nr:hypothetical protein BCV70DRAFT_32030 [Testicularia cyperi]
MSRLTYLLPTSFTASTVERVASLGAAHVCRQLSPTSPAMFSPASLARQIGQVRDSSWWRNSGCQISPVQTKYTMSLRRCTATGARILMDGISKSKATVGVVGTCTRYKHEPRLDPGKKFHQEPEKAGDVPVTVSRIMLLVAAWD